VGLDAKRGDQAAEPVAVRSARADDAIAVATGIDERRTAVVAEGRPLVK
jgi:hypothetical protein